MIHLSMAELMEYTDWERSEWLKFLRKHGPQTLALTAGPYGDGRFQSVGELIKHVFGAEMRYVDRLHARPLTDSATIPDADLDALFAFGQASRRELRQLLDTFPAAEWDTPRQFQIMTFRISATPRKIAAHVLLHEIRHWAQIATLLRLNGFVPEFHDFLVSPVLGGELQPE